MDAFAAEQQVLARTCWQFVALRDELAQPNSWVRRLVFGKVIFVQNFGGELRAYHNACAHRGFPLRCEEAGVGPVHCGFHGWTYSRDGVPTGIPRNGELFQLSRDQQRDLALPEVRLESIGRFVFATLSADAPPIVDYLGPYADVYRTLDRSFGRLVHRESSRTLANWKRHVEITLDDYHLASVHPTTFGVFGDSPPHTFYYQRDGAHSCYLRRRDPDWSFDSFWAGMRAGTEDRTGYKIFNCFPNFLIATSADMCVAWVAAPLDAGHSIVDLYMFPWKDRTFTAEEERGLVEFAVKVFHEDRVACEQWQTTIADLTHPPVLGRLEDRIGWFRASYDELMSQAPPSP